MKHRSNWTPAIVSNRADRTSGETKVREANGTIPGPALSALNVTYLDEGRRIFRRHVKSFKPENSAPSRPSFYNRRRFRTILALPMLVRMGVHCRRRHFKGELMVRHLLPKPLDSGSISCFGLCTAFVCA
jgi:hypothetical protein